MRTVVFGLLLTLCVVVMQPCSAEGQKALTNADVVQMVQAGLPESTILLSVRNSPAAFKTAPTDLINLTKAGVPQAVMDAMLIRGGASIPNAAATPGPGIPPGSIPEVAGPPGVAAVDGDRRVPLMQSSNQLTSERAGFSPASLVGLGDKTKSYVNLPGTRSPVRLTSRSPSFEVVIPPNVHAQEVISVIRTQIHKDSRRILEEVRMQGLDALMNKSGSIKEGRLAFSVEPIAGGPQSQFGSPYRVILAAPLEPGEYAIQHQGVYWDFGID